MPSDTPQYPSGEFCIVELFGHQTLVGRFEEVERFGTKMLALEPLFNDQLLNVVYHGGQSIYRLTPCSADTAFRRQPRNGFQLPPAIRAVVPVALLESPAAPSDSPWSDPEDDGEDPL